MKYDLERKLNFTSYNFEDSSFIFSDSEDKYFYSDADHNDLRYLILSVNGDYSCVGGEFGQDTSSESIILKIVPLYLETVPEPAQFDIG